MTEPTDGWDSVIAWESIASSGTTTISEMMAVDWAPAVKSAGPRPVTVESAAMASAAPPAMDVSVQTPPEQGVVVITSVSWLLRLRELERSTSHAAAPSSSLPSSSSPPLSISAARRRRRAAAVTLHPAGLVAHATASTCGATSAASTTPPGGIAMGIEVVIVTAAVCPGLAVELCAALMRSDVVKPLMSAVTETEVVTVVW